MENNVGLQKKNISSNDGGAALSINIKVASSNCNDSLKNKNCELDDSRKKRCSDRYDSSESSDRYVLFLKLVFKVYNYLFKLHYRSFLNL